MVRLRTVTMAEAPRLAKILDHPAVAEWWGRHDITRVEQEVIDPGDGTVVFVVEVDERGHHRLTIDPAAHNQRAIRSYASVGFRPVGVMRRYERGPDGTWHDGLLMDLLAEELT